jgi:hypothetical protein
MDELLKDSRIRIITGHYGSGKTEFSINYALQLHKVTDQPVVLGDIDTVNPYFTTREQRATLEALGIRVVAQSMGLTSVDVPAQPQEIQGMFVQPGQHVVLDVGGDAAGAKIVGSYHRFLSKEAVDLFLVVNANRSYTQSADQVEHYIESISAAARLPVTKLVNNTHMIRETTLEDLQRGNQLILEVAERTGIPVRYTSGIQTFLEEGADSLAGTHFPIDLYVRPTWL